MMLMLPARTRKKTLMYTHPNTETDSALGWWKWFTGNSWLLNLSNICLLLPVETKRFKQSNDSETQYDLFMSVGLASYYNVWCKQISIVLLLLNTLFTVHAILIYQRNCSRKKLCESSPLKTQNPTALMERTFYFPFITRDDPCWKEHAYVVLGLSVIRNSCSCFLKTVRSVSQFFGNRVQNIT